MNDWRHLARRLAGSLRPGGPRRRLARWAESNLLQHERRLWLRMSGPDRRHAAAAADEAARRLGDAATRPVIAAALLHDVGKTESGLRTYGRVVATLAGRVAGPDQAREWQRGRGFTRRVGLYLRHDVLGGDLLEIGGSDPVTVTWAREHHRPPEEWSIDPEIGAVLSAVDHD